METTTGTVSSLYKPDSVDGDIILADSQRYIPYALFPCR